MIGVNLQINTIATDFNGKDGSKDCPSLNNFMPMEDEYMPEHGLKKFVLSEIAGEDTTIKCKSSQDVTMGSEFYDEAISTEENKENTAIESENKHNNEVMESEIKVVKCVPTESKKNESKIDAALESGAKKHVSKEELEEDESLVKTELAQDEVKHDNNNHSVEPSAIPSLSEVATCSVVETRGKKRKIEETAEALFTLSNQNGELNDMVNNSKSPSAEEQKSPINLDSNGDVAVADNCSSLSSSQNNQDLIIDAALIENSPGQDTLENSFETSNKQPASALQPNQLCIVPDEEDSKKLSDYNNFLTQNIQIYLVDVNDQSQQQSSSPDISYVTAEKLASTRQRIGLRCIHCANEGYHVYGATFLPKNITSLSSGLGTICARHILAEKCPHASSSLIEKLRQSKQTSQSQTRKRGMSLDCYCKDILTRNLGLINYNEVKQNSFTSSNNGGKQSVDQTEYTKIHGETVLGDDMGQPFQPSAIDNFWECKNCTSVPYLWRASGSVVYCDTIPSNNLVQKHLNICKGKKALRIPRNASIHILDDDYKKIRIKWDSSDNGTSDSLDLSSIEEKGLVTVTDKDYTTDFAFFTFLQLKVTYLTKTGGSRGACPAGFPGLACIYCSDTPNERKFFYTSSDHLRNSFSHIPVHLMQCTNCPEHIKSKLDGFKSVRNKQKSQLKIGSHKMFIDRVWERMHGPLSSTKCDRTLEDIGQQEWPNGSSKIIKEKDQDIENEMVYSYGRSSSNNDVTSTSTPDSSNNSTQIVSPEDKHLVTEFTYFTMQQMIPCHLKASGNGARSAFEVGFPGLECCHCTNTANARRFFYRTSDILSGNYAHIPNHLLVCKSCPTEIKAALEAKKSYHLQQKVKLGRGSQRIFFARVWRRLHGIKKSICQPVLEQNSTHVQDY